MKIITIGDIHGRIYWKEIDINKYDKIVFVADYVDSFYYTDEEIYANLLDIIQLKKSYPDKVVLLLGNHDIQYLFLGEGFGCSGFRPSMAENLHFLFKKEKDLFQIAFQIDNFLWTHAGVSTGWYDWNKKEIESVEKKFDTKNYADLFNHMLWLKENRLLHQVGKNRGGAYPFGGITWADRRETSTDYLPNIHQIVGHSPINQITKFGDEHGSIRYVDVLGEYENYLKDKTAADLKWGNKNEYDKKIREMFPELESKKEEFHLTKFYEHSI
jgi:hypothetical protein